MDLEFLHTHVVCEPQGGEPNMEMASVGFYIFHGNVGRFRSFFIKNETEPNTSRSVSRSVSRRNKPNGQNCEGLGVQCR